MQAAFFAHAHLNDRDEATSQHVYGPNVELLIGDGMLSLGYEIVARPDGYPDPADPERVLRAIAEIAWAVGSQGVVEAEYRARVARGEGWAEKACEKTEGGLHACAAASGAILGGGDEAQVERLRKFGLWLGMLDGAARKEDGKLEFVEKLRGLGLKGLKHFRGGRAAPFSQLLDFKTLAI